MNFDYDQWMKRAFDLAAALALIGILWPVLLAIGLYIKIRSPGPVLFKQERIGLGGRPFWILKFRTMHVRPAAAPESSVSIRDDPRIFPGGHWLRRWKLDELPQLWNVVEGNMSLVGPRPTVDDDYGRMTPRQRERWSVPPGITGLAQIRGGTAMLWPERIEWDLEYVRTHTLALDLRILLETCVQVFSGRADTHPPGEDEWSAAA
jgi:lipopolysaccharide/colanic/teichoic acid biosynthesis glycosyltransferase